MINKKHLIYIFLCVNTLLFSACGIKPAYVEPPEGAQHKEFPKTYPSIETDPLPGLENKNL